MYMFVMVGGIVIDYCRKVVYVILCGNLQCEIYCDVLIVMDFYKYFFFFIFLLLIFSVKFFLLSIFVCLVLLELQFLYLICEVVLLIGRDGVYFFLY